MQLVKMSSEMEREQKKTGVIFGYRAVSDYGSFADGQGHVYNFGRSAQKEMVECNDIQPEGEVSDLATRQKELLKKCMRRTGLNAPSKVLLWAVVSDLDRYWDEFKMQLQGWGGRLPVEGKDPLVTQQQVVGDYFYTVENMGVEEFGTWCNAILSKVLSSWAQD